MRLLIATGIYPPQVGGPAQYAKELAESFKRVGWKVVVKSFKFEHYLPSLIRHLFFAIKIVPSILKSDLVIALDTFSVGLPAGLVARLFGKKVMIRTGGDFLWEGYVERTRKKVLLKNFYTISRDNWNLKEKIIFSLTKKILHRVNQVIFSTEWQREIFITAYQLPRSRTDLIENYYGPQEIPEKPSTKTFIGSTRPLIWKNLETLSRAFSAAKVVDKDLILDLDQVPYEEFLKKIRRAYAVILVSLGDISPNLILDAIRLGKPFILTRETGLYDKLRDIGIFVDPLNEEEITEKILELSNPEEYIRQCSKIAQFNYLHTWDQIRDEFIAIANKIQR